jgi:hypothetical protein
LDSRSYFDTFPTYGQREYDEWYALPINNELKISFITQEALHGMMRAQGSRMMTAQPNDKQLHHLPAKIQE